MFEIFGSGLKARDKRYDALTYFVYLLLIIFFGLPLLWVLLLSIRNAEEVYTIARQLIPDHPTLDNYVTVLSDGKIQQFLWNSVKLASMGTILGFIGAAPAAYSMSRFRFRGASILLVAVLALQMIAPLVIMIPLYRFMADLKLLDSQLVTGLIYAALVMPFMTWILKGFFDAIPIDIDEAAMIDGCTRFQAFRKVVLPVAGPGVASALVLAVIAGWGQFVVPLILLKRTSDLPISVGILVLQNKSVGAISTEQILAAGTIVAVSPVVILFLLMQRFVIRGLTQGAIKG